MVKLVHYACDFTHFTNFTHKNAWSVAKHPVSSFSSISPVSPVSPATFGLAVGSTSIPSSPGRELRLCPTSTSGKSQGYIYIYESSMNHL